MPDDPTEFLSDLADQVALLTDLKNDLNPQDISGSHFVMTKTLPGVGLCGVTPMLFNWALEVGIDSDGCSDRYDFPTMSAALTALDDWDGSGDPGDQWIRHLRTGRRRNPKTGETWISP